MDSIVGMRIFPRVVEAGSLSAAGRLLGLAPSSVSRQIGDIERALGVRLFHRTTRKLSLTEAGETYYERAHEILQAVDEAKLAVTEERASPSGVLRVATPASIAGLHIAPAVAAFQALYPAVTVALAVSDRMADIVGEGLDIALRLGRLDDSRLVARKLGEARRLVCASPAYLDRAGQPTHPSQLAEHACLTFRQHPGSNLWRFRRGDERVEVRATGPFFADDGATLVSAASVGLGLVLVPEWLAGPQIGTGRLVQVLSDFAAEPDRTPIYAIYAPGPYVAPKIRAFVDFLAQRFGGGYDWRERPRGRS